MTNAEEKRIFIGGLVKGVREEEIVEKFSRFGQVSNVEIKTRTTDTDSKTFAYLSLTAEDKAFKKCFTAYNNTKWKGGQLKIQFAKESFLNKLKKEQAETKMSQGKSESKPTPVSKNPVLESDKKAVPGTLMDDKGTWVMGKYSRVLPVLHVRKPGTRKIVTLDPSKMTHCLKKLKSDDFDAERPGDLTWHLEENISDINKRRQGQFPTLETPRYHSTPKEQSAIKQEPIFSRLQGLATEEYISDIEMEVVPVGKLGTVLKLEAINGYNSDHSAGSADTDEIVSKASSKKTSKMTTMCSTGSKAGMKKKGHVKSLAGCDLQSDDESAGPSHSETPSQISSLEKIPTSFNTKNQSKVKSSQSNMKGVGTEEKQRPHFQFLKTPKLKGRVLKKSVKLSQNKKSFTECLSSDKDNEEIVEDTCVVETSGKRKPPKKTPEFKGLSMLSIDSEDSMLPTNSTETKGKKGPQTSSESATAVTCAKVAHSSLDQKGLQDSVDSDSEDTDDILSTTKRQTHEKMNTVSRQELEIGSKKNKSSQNKQEKVATCDSESTGVGLGSRKCKTGSSLERSGSVGQLVGDDLDEYGSGLLTESTVPQKRKRYKSVSSNDSDLDDNDFEKVGKKLAARALQQQQRGHGSCDRHQQAVPIVNAASVCDSRRRKPSEVEEGHLTMTSMQKSHQAYSKVKKEQKKKDNIITKMLREGTGSTHIQFSDTEEEDRSEKKKPAPMSLFSDNDSDSDAASGVDFSVRPQFEGSKGKKLFELQSKITDERFRFDDRFESDDSGSESENMVEQDSEGETETEKKRNMEILEKVLGYKPRQRTRMVYEDMSKRRYIPEETTHLDLSSGVKSKKREKRKNVSAETPSTDLSSGSGAVESSQKCLLESQSPDPSDHKSASCESDDSNMDESPSPESHDPDQQDRPSKESSDDDQSDLSKGGNLKDLFQGGGAFTFFGSPDLEDVPDSEPVRFSQVDMEKDEDDDEEEGEEDDDEEEGEEDDDEEEGEEEDEEMSALCESRITETERASPSVQQQPSFMVARDDPRLAAAVRFFKRPPEEEFEEHCERWPEERQKIMQLVRERHKRACRKERKMKQGTKSWPFAKTRK